MNYRHLISICLAVVALGLVAVGLEDGLVAVVVCIALSTVALVVFRGFTDEKDFVTTIFLGALLARLAFGVLVHAYELREFFGGDALSYDFTGWRLVASWTGQIPADAILRQRVSTSAPGWGMYYLTAGIYYLIGRNILAAQSFCAVFGAATAPMVYFCARKMFGNQRVAKTSAIAIAFFPSFIIWSSQLMKDGLIIFLLVLAMTLVLQLQEKISYSAILLLLFALIGILTLRFYIFYMALIAVGGSFLIGVSGSVQSIIRRSAIIALLGIGMIYFGVMQNASSDFEKYGNLQRIQQSRQDLAVSAKSGFGEDVDVSTTEGALSVVPVGLVYLMFAPFPWQMANLRQLITLPEVLAWWATMPLLVSGIGYSVRHRLRSSIPVVIFSLSLTLAYSIFQGNVGTAYRQRTQIQVFLFIFIAVGIQLMYERREDKKLRRMAIERRNRAITAGMA